MTSRTSRTLLAIAAAALLVVSARESLAVLIPVHFEARVISVGQVNAFGGVSIDDTFSGTYVFDSNVADSPLGFYDFTGPSVGLTSQIGSTLVVLPDFRIRISNDAGGPPADVYTVSGNTGSGQNDVFFDFTVRDASASVFGDHELPPSLSIANFDFSIGTVRLNQPTTLNPLAQFEITSISYVPEPTSFLLLGSSLLALAATARRSRAGQRRL